MALNTATANVKGGLFGDSSGLLQLTSISGKNATRSNPAKTLGTKSQFAMRRIMYVTAGAAAGATATYTFPSIEAVPELGGKRNILQVNLINRATTAADVAEYKNDILTWSTRTTFGANPVPNKDGNPLGTR